MSLLLLMSTFHMQPTQLLMQAGVFVHSKGRGLIERNQIRGYHSVALQSVVLYRLTDDCTQLWTNAT